MKKTKTTFQSYLILGQEPASQLELDKLLGKFNIKISNNSPDINIVDILSPQTSHYLKNTPIRISINQIRQMKKSIFNKPFTNTFKVAIVKNADKLTIEAQNALLKILEEPPASALIILMAYNKSAFLPTIVSRLKTIQAKQNTKGKAGEGDINNLNLAALLNKTSNINDPVKWLDDQIISQHTLLKKTIYKNRSAISAKITENIEKCIRAKKMIQANVNPKLVLFNLALELNIS